MDTRAALLELVEAVPAGAVVTVPARWILDVLQQPAETGDLTVKALAKHYGRGVSCARAWVERGLFPGAFKLAGKEWRVPVAALEAFEHQPEVASTLRRLGKDPLAQFRMKRGADAA